ncbi:hypothetical protein A2765_03215 [Candidatus Kaiserbacteria bacterium RIFCSPHIGHO2_01_FULL_56_24]|uniref:Uncharacterized protein n=1 Tax=Candidatus Kaiserbacteria bacterium RIFCSPHIGHO2_01_FULL_56_24 TaxID=1798487 RepID=A0A1F6D9U5_9BACT|nr:MAG: hypothetical protein A2765_03215 [Candidatus Kaiserbacteria bacterium RIFCSPHIGHO2_01_FULL_56_24]
MAKKDRTKKSGSGKTKRHRYVGRVRFVNENDSPKHAWGYIDEKSVAPVGGSPPFENPTGEGIYIRAADGDRPLRIGMELEFELVPDESEKRPEGAFRAHDASETAPSRLKGLTEGGIELLVPNREMQDSVFFMSWCLQPRVLEGIRQLLLQSEEAMLLVVQVRLTGDPKKPAVEEKRQLIPLDGKENMAALSFNSAGHHRIVAVLLAGRRRKIVDDYMSTGYAGWYNHDVLSSSGDCLLTEVRQFGTGSIQVEIPQGVFAEKPWGYNYINSYFRKPPKDECRFFWYRVVPIWLLQIVRIPWMVFWGGLKIFCGSIAAAAMACVVYGVEYKYFVLHPYTTPIPYMFSNVHGWRIDDAKKYWIGRLALNPRTWIVAAIGLALFFFGPRETPEVVHTVRDLDMQPLIKPILTGLAWAVGVVGVIALVISGANRVDWNVIFERYRARRQARREERRRLEAERRREAVEVQVRDLMCTTTGPRLPDPKLLGWKPSTIYFRVIDFKRKRCKNFSAA